MNRCVDVGLSGLILVGENLSFQRKTAAVPLHLQNISISIILESNQSLRDETPVTIRIMAEPEKC
jgi:hypothetical protein